MRTRSIAALVLSLSCATLASAQGSPSGQAADSGFFRPSPDPSLTAPRQPQPARPTEALTAEDKVQANDEKTADRAPDPVKVMRWSEEQMDRSEGAAEQSKPSGPAPINGAFTGLTDGRNR